MLIENTPKVATANVPDALKTIANAMKRKLLAPTIANASVSGIFTFSFSLPKII